MNPRNYPEPSAPPPPYASVVNDNRQEYRSDQNYPNSRETPMPGFDEFVRRYESEYFSQNIFAHIHLFSQSKFC